MLAGHPVTVIDVTEDGIGVEDETGQTHIVAKEELQEIKQQTIEQQGSVAPEVIENPINGTVVNEQSQELSDLPEDSIPDIATTVNEQPVTKDQLEQIPLTKDGEPDYDSMEPEMLVRELGNRGLSNDEIADILSMSIEPLEAESGYSKEKN